jgi:hypothetical protein
LSIAGAGQAHYRTIDDPRHLYHDVVVVLDLARDINNGQPAALARWIDALQRVFEKRSRICKFGSNSGCPGFARAGPGKGEQYRIVGRVGACGRGMRSN